MILIRSSGGSTMSRLRVQNNFSFFDEIGRRLGLIGYSDENVNDIIARPMNPEIEQQFTVLMSDKSPKGQSFN
jgi:hypothetical protein